MAIRLNRLESENTSSSGKAPEDIPAAGTVENVQCEEEEIVEIVEEAVGDKGGDDLEETLQVRTP